MNEGTSVLERQEGNGTWELTVIVIMLINQMNTEANPNVSMKKRYKIIHSAEKILEIVKFWEKKNTNFFKVVDFSKLSALVKDHTSMKYILIFFLYKARHIGLMGEMKGIIERKILVGIQSGMDVGRVGGDEEYDQSTFYKSFNELIAKESQMSVSNQKKHSRFIISYLY